MQSGNRRNKQPTLSRCFSLLGCSVLFLFFCLVAEATTLPLSRSCMSLKKASSLKRISEISTRRSSPQSFRVRPTNLLRESWCRKQETRAVRKTSSTRTTSQGFEDWAGGCTCRIPPSCRWKKRTNSLLSSFCCVRARTMRRTDVNSCREHTSSMFSWLKETEHDIRTVHVRSMNELLM